MKVPMQRTKRPRVEMLPLIDIVFLLLVFFIYAMLSMAVHRALPVRLPGSATAKIDKTLLLSVTVQEDGGIFLDGEEVLLEDLGPALRHRDRAHEETGVLLFADRALSYQDLFRVLDEIREAGITRISLQAEAED